jgi:hypothetical protein
MEHLARKLINWASILEPGTREQALQTACIKVRRSSACNM